MSNYAHSLYKCFMDVNILFVLVLKLQLDLLLNCPSEIIAMLRLLETDSLSDLRKLMVGHL